MARNIETIKKEMTDTFMADATIRAKYGMTDPTATWASLFSKVSIENIIFYVVASAIYVLEVLFDEHSEEVSETISKRAHTLTWYRQKALAFEKGKELSEELAEYDNTGLTDDEIEELQIVKKCSCEVADATYPTIIVKATKEDGAMTTAEFEQFKSYMNAVADAGIRLSMVSKDPDTLSMNITIWYDPLVLDSTGVLTIDGETKPVEDEINDYLSDLPFNGTFYPQLLESDLLKAQGVKMAKVNSAKVGTTEINDWYKPESGALTWDGGSTGYTITYENFTNTYTDED